MMDDLKNGYGSLSGLGSSYQKFIRRKLYLGLTMTKRKFMGEQLGRRLATSPSLKNYQEFIGSMAAFS